MFGHNGVWLAAAAAVALGALVGPARAHRPHDVVGGLAASPDGRVVLAHVRLKLYRSLDGGRSWSGSQLGLTNADGWWRSC